MMRHTYTVFILFLGYRKHMDIKKWENSSKLHSSWKTLSTQDTQPFLYMYKTLNIK